MLIEMNYEVMNIGANSDHVMIVNATIPNVVVAKNRALIF